MTGQTDRQTVGRTPCRYIDPAAEWQQADLVVMKLFLERVDVVGDGSLRGEGAAGVGEPCYDAVE